MKPVEIGTTELTTRYKNKTPGERSMKKCSKCGYKKCKCAVKEQLEVIQRVIAEKAPRPRFFKSLLARARGKAVRHPPVAKFIRPKKPRVLG